MTAAGNLKEPLLLLKPQQSQAADGTITRSYQQVAMVWGQVGPTKGQEATFADRLSSTYPMTITLRRRTDIAEGWRVERDGQSLRVRTVPPSPPSDPFMQIGCEQEEGGHG